MIYCIVQNFDRDNFDVYWLFKYLTETILTDGHWLSPYTCKCCIVFKQFDSLAGKCQNFPQQNFALYGIISKEFLRVTNFLGFHSCPLIHNKKYIPVYHICFAARMVKFMRTKLHGNYKSKQLLEIHKILLP